MLHFRKSMTSALCLLAMGAHFSAFAVLSDDELSDGEAAPSRMSASAVSSAATPVESTQPNNSATPKDLDRFVTKVMKTFNMDNWDIKELEEILAPIPPEEQDDFISLAQGPCNPGMYEVDRLDADSMYSPIYILGMLAKVHPEDLDKFCEIVDWKLSLNGPFGVGPEELDGDGAEEIVQKCYDEHFTVTKRARSKP